MIDRLFVHIDKLSTFSTKKLSSSSSTNDTYYFINDSNKLYSGDPDIKWNSIVFIKEEGLIWTHGKLYGEIGLGGKIDEEIERAKQSESILNSRINTIAELINSLRSDLVDIKDKLDIDTPTPPDIEIPEEPEPVDPPSDEPVDPLPEENLEYVDLYKYIRGYNGGHINTANSKLTTGAVTLETEINLDSPIKGTYLALSGGNYTIDGVKYVCGAISLIPLNSDGTKYGITYTRQAEAVPVDNPKGEFNIGDTVHIKASTNNLNINGIDYPLEGDEVRKAFGLWLFANTLISNSNYRYYGLMKYFKVYNDGTLVNSFYPAKTTKELPITMVQGYKPTSWTVVPVGTIGLWDLVQNQLSINNNSASTSGLDVEEDPAEINEYLERHNWLRADGSKYSASYRPIAGSNTYKSKNVTMRTIIKVDSLNSTVGSTTSVFGSSGLYDGVRQRQINLVLKRLDNTTFTVGYFSCAEKDLALDNNSFVGTFNIGDTLEIEASEGTITINGTVYNNPVSSIQTMNLVNFHVLYSGSSNGDKQYSAQIARVEYIADGTTYSSLVPAKVIKELPIELSYDGKVKDVGTVGMWDLKNEKFLTSSADNNWSVNNSLI